LTAKQQHFRRVTLHKARDALCPLFYKPVPPKILNQIRHQKTGNGDGAMGSKSKLEIMKANPTLKNETTQKKSKKENAPDIISKSILFYTAKKCQSNRKSL